jgi:chromosome segregation ATPase
MWLWWVVSLVILLSSIIFSLYIYYGSYKSTQLKQSFLKSNYSFFKKAIPVTRQQLINSLKLKLQSVENNSTLYFNEPKKLQQRIQTLGKNKGFDGGNTNTTYGENWEELYYNIHDEKEKIESELDITNQKLEETESLIAEYKRRENVWKEKRSELENEANRNEALKHKIEEHQQQLQGSAAREMELLQDIEGQKKVRIDFELLQQQYAYIQSEADELRNRIKEINNRDILLQQKINRLTELESNIETSQYDK